MSCFHPLDGYRDRTSGQVSIGYWAGQEGDHLSLPCGRCIGCRQDRAREWSIRCMHEAQLWDSNLFVTLSYDNEHLPASLSLEYEDFQSFMRRLRKVVKGVSVAPNGRRPIRFFVAGEYGERYARPHWHALLFNCRLPDSVRFFNGTYRSALLEKVWGNGGIVIGDVTPRSAAYVAGYTIDKRYGRDAEDHYEDVVDPYTGEVFSRRPEFVEMSRKPGIAYWWYQKYASDIFPYDTAIVDGRKNKVPGYYWRKFQCEGDPNTVEDISEARITRAKGVDREENTEERRAVREEVAWRRVKTFSPRRF